MDGKEAAEPEHDPSGGEGQKPKAKDQEEQNCISKRRGAEWAGWSCISRAHACCPHLVM